MTSQRMLESQLATNWGREGHKMRAYSQEKIPTNRPPPPTIVERLKKNKV